MSEVPIIITAHSEGYTGSSGPLGPRVRPPMLGEERKRGASFRRSTADQYGNLAPAMRLRFMLGDDADTDDNVEHPLFSELQEFHYQDSHFGEWKETARWIKFEEDVEDGGCRWTKPFVGTLSLHALFELRSHLLNGTVLLDLPGVSIANVIDLITNDMVCNGQLSLDQKDKLVEVLLRPHRHLYELQKANTLLGVSDRSRNASSKNLMESRSKNDLKQGVLDSPNPSEQKKGNAAFMKKIPPDAEVANVLIGEVDFLDKPVAAFVRLTNATILGDLTEVPLPSRFVFILMGPRGDLEIYKEVGRVVATLMSDEVFHSVAYRAKARDHLLVGIDEFMDAVTVLPPGEWDPKIRIEPPDSVPSQEPRKNPNKPQEIRGDPDEEEFLLLQSQGLVRTGRFFGGLIDDVKRKAPWYKSDFTDAFHIQSVASITFLYFASLSPIITFGGLLGDATENRLAAVESLCAGCICGLIYSLFAGQPLSLLNATGPVLVFESIVYSFCKKYGFYYLSLRLWIGVWIGVFMIILCAFEISAWVAYITRFTEENFAMLIATIYVYKAIEKIIHIAQEYPLLPPEHKFNATDCYCVPPNDTELFPFNDGEETHEIGPIHWVDQLPQNCSEFWNGTLVGEDCFPDEWYPNVFLMSVLLSILTYFLCVRLKAMKHTPYFPSTVRNMISDFAVLIAICSMTVVDTFTNIHTPKLYVPDELRPTWKGRGWVITPFHPDNPWWIIPACMLPAMLATILMFLDQQITAVIVNRRENKLKKGCGYHLDLFVLGILTVLMGVLGLPWHVAGTVICINHINSLKKESESAAPGDKPMFLGVREQRLTHFFIFLLVGLSVFMTPVLRFIPMPVLYGVFLYMGTAPLSEMQFYDRLRIVFMPTKYQPDFPYLRQVRLKRVHMFTVVQLVCFAILWVVKTNEIISISFPLMLVVMIFIRKSLDFVYTKEELRALDAVLPPFRQKKSPATEGQTELNGLQSTGNLPKNKSQVNISDEVTKSGVWKHVNESKQPQRSVEMKNFHKGDIHTEEEAKPLTCERCS